MAEPFLNLRILKRNNFRIAVVISMLLYAVMMGSSTIYPILIQTVAKKSAVISALIMLPGSLVMALINPVTGRFYDRFGISKLALAGGLLMVLSCWGVTMIDSAQEVIVLGVLYLLRLLGVGFLMMPIVTWGMQNLPADEVAHGIALLTALRTLSGALGTTVFTEIMTNGTHLTNPHSTSSYASIQYSFKAMTVLALVQVIISLLQFRKR